RLRVHRRPAFPVPSVVRRADEFCRTRARNAARERCAVSEVNLRHSGARVQRANPESISPRNSAAQWIPGLRLSAHPGMTVLKLRGEVMRTLRSPDAAYGVARC